jgi:hypothetical protein
VGITGPTNFFLLHQNSGSCAVFLQVEKPRQVSKAAAWRTNAFMIAGVAVTPDFDGILNVLSS